MIMPSTLSLPSATGLNDAMQRVSRYVPATPLVRNETLSRMFGLNIYLKIETVTEVGSFKLRGAINCVIAKGADASSIVTASTGNHGQGVAYAARVLGKPSNIFLPENPNLEKKRKIEALGATTTIVGRDYNVAKDAAQTFARETGGLFVDDGEDLTVMEGAGTIGVEVGAALEQVDYLVVPMGGGTLISGCGAGIKLRHPTCDVHCHSVPRMRRRCMKAFSPNGPLKGMFIRWRNALRSGCQPIWRCRPRWSSSITVLSSRTMISFPRPRRLLFMAIFWPNRVLRRPSPVLRDLPATSARARRSCLW